MIPGIRTAIAAAAVDPSRPAPDGLRAPKPEAVASRFAVYRNTVAVTLVAALAARFSTVARLVGDDFFKSMARAFVAGRRPDLPMLSRYGDDFPGFVAGFGPASGLPYLADVARLDAAVSRVAEAADVPPLAVAALAGLPAEGLAACRLVAHPAAALVRSPWPVGTIWSRQRQETPEPVRGGGPEAVLVTRPADDVDLLRLGPGEAAFVAALLDGAPLGAAATAAFDIDPAFDFGRALAGAVRAGAFAGIHLEGRTE